jgi:hypothetical protein
LWVEYRARPNSFGRANTVQIEPAGATAAKSNEIRHGTIAFVCVVRIWQHHWLQAPFLQLRPHSAQFIAIP